MKTESGYVIDGMIRSRLWLGGEIIKDDVRYSPAQEYIQKLEIPFSDLLLNLYFKDGVFKCSLFACKQGCYSDDLYGVIQHRQKELEENGYEVQFVDNSAWGDIRKTLIVYDKQKTMDRVKDKKFRSVFLKSSVAIFVLTLIFCFVKGIG